MANWDKEKKALWDEDRVVQAFCRWLEGEGWTVRTEVDFSDVVAERGNQKIIAEAKGRVAARPGAGVDSLYGQLLRRMPAQGPSEDLRFAVVVPESAKKAVLRVAPRIRDQLGIDIYLVSDDNQVQRLQP